jgi:putative DNA primase/helicase
LVEHLGWHGGRFLLGSETIGPGDESLMIDGGPSFDVARVQHTGTLQNWQTNVAAPCAGSSYLVFALCLSLAAPLLRLARLESGCVHFSGVSNQDTGLIQSVAGTIFGGPSDVGYVRPWTEAMAVPAPMAEGHSDLPLILSDVNGLDADPKIAVQKASNIASSVTSSPVQRHFAHQGGRFAGAAPRTSLLVISAGDRRLIGHARIARCADDEARIIDIPAPSRGTGIFDRLVSSSSQEGRDFAARLQASCSAHFGTAGRAFVQTVVSAVAKDEVHFKARLDRRMSEFFEKAGVEESDAYEVQFAKRFALAYAAGILASDQHLVPWPRKLIKRCIRRCYWRARERRAGPQEEIRKAADAILCRLRATNDIADLRGTVRPIELDLAKRAKALLLPHDDGSCLLALRPEIFRALVGPKVSGRAVAAELERRGALIPRPNGRRTRQLRVPGTEHRRDYYCLRGDLIDDDW